MSISTLVANLQIALDDFSHKVHLARLKKWEHISEAENSDRLEGLLLDEVKSRLMDIVLTHVGLINSNVHGLLPSDIDAYPKLELDEKIYDFLDFDSGIPYSFWGNSSCEETVVSGIGTWTLTFSNNLPCMLNGYFKINDLEHIEIDDSNKWKTIHVWLKRNLDELTYDLEITDYELNLSDFNIDRSDQMYLGYLTTNGSGIKYIGLEKSIAIGGYRISPWKAGRSIPVSDGLPMDPQTLNWV